MHLFWTVPLAGIGMMMVATLYGALAGLGVWFAVGLLVYLLIQLVGPWREYLLVHQQHPWWVLFVTVVFWPLFLADVCGQAF